MQSVAENPSIDECAALPPEVQAWRAAREAWPQLMTAARSHALLAFSAWVFSEVEAGRSVDPTDAQALSDLADSHGVRTVEFLREAFAAGLFAPALPATPAPTAIANDAPPSKTPIVVSEIVQARARKALAERGYVVNRRRSR